MRVSFTSNANNMTILSYDLVLCGFVWSEPFQIFVHVLLKMLYTANEISSYFMNQSEYGSPAVS